MAPPPEEMRGEFPMTLDLRRPRHSVTGTEDLAETSDALDLALRQYRSKAGRSDLMLGAKPAMAAYWQATAGGAGRRAGRAASRALQERAGQQVLDLGMAFRLAGGSRRAGVAAQSRAAAAAVE